jgi:hypothetical protein
VELKWDDDWCHRIVCWKVTNILKHPGVQSRKVLLAKYGGSSFPWNNGNILPDYIASHSRREQFSDFAKTIFYAFIITVGEILRDKWDKSIKKKFWCHTWCHICFFCCSLQVQFSFPWKQQNCWIRSVAEDYKCFPVLHGRHIFFLQLWCLLSLHSLTWVLKSWQTSELAKR